MAWSYQPKVHWAGNAGGDNESVKTGLVDWVVQIQTAFLADTEQTGISEMASLAYVEKTEFSDTALLADSEQVKELGMGGRAGIQTLIIILSAGWRNRLGAIILHILKPC